VFKYFECIIACVILMVDETEGESGLISGWRGGPPYTSIKTV